MTLRQDLKFYQGQTFSYPFIKKDSAGNVVDISGYSAKLAIKGTFNGVLQAYMSTGSDGTLGTISIDGPNGKATLSMTATETSQLAGELNALTVILLHDDYPIQSAFDFVDITRPIAEYLYDFYLVDTSGVATRELQGRAMVYRQITT